FRANAPGIPARPVEGDREKVGRAVQIAYAIAIDRGRRVQVVDHEIERAVIVEIHVGRAVREPVGRETPGPGDVVEPEIAGVAEQIVGARTVRHPRNETRRWWLDAGRNAVQRG